MAERAILQIPVNTEAWDAFVDSFLNYQRTLENQGDAWATTNKGIKELKSSFDDVEASFGNLVEAAESPKLGKAFAGVDRTSKETAKSWISIQKTIERSSKDLAGMVRDGGKFSALGSFLGVGGLAIGVGSLFGATRGADASLADQNILNRKLGLKPGEEPAFSNVYEKAGGDRALLGKVATAQATPSQWQYLQAAGITQQEIRSKDAAALSAELLEKVGERVNKFGLAQTNQWLQAQGVGNLVDPNQARLAGSYSSTDFTNMSKQFAELVPKLAASQKQLDEATAARSKLEASLAQDALELDKAFIKLNPLMIDAAGKVTNFITAFAESGQLEKDIKLAENAFEKVGQAGDWLADKLNDLFGLKGKDGQGTPLYSAPAGSVGANLTQFGENVWASLHGGQWDSGPSKSVFWNPFGTDATQGTVGNASNNPGNLRVPGSKTAFQQFDSPQAGIKAADNQLVTYWEKHHLDTVSGIINRWAPPSENDTGSYIRDVSSRTGFDPDKPLDMSDPKVRAALEAAMFKHEGVKGFGNLTPQQILDINTGRVPADKSPFEDPKAVKTAKAADASSNPQRMPFRSDDDAAASIRATNNANPDNKVVDSVVDRLVRGLGMIGNTLREGGGSFARGDDRTAQRIAHQGNQPMTPYQINVKVSAPAGSSTVVTTGTLAQ